MGVGLRQVLLQNGRLQISACYKSLLKGDFCITLHMVTIVTMAATITDIYQKCIIFHKGNDGAKGQFCKSMRIKT